MTTSTFSYSGGDGITSNDNSNSTDYETRGMIRTGPAIVRSNNERQQATTGSINQKQPEAAQQTTTDSQKATINSQQQPTSNSIMVWLAVGTNRQLLPPSTTATTAKQQATRNKPPWQCKKQQLPNENMARYFYRYVRFFLSRFSFVPDPFR